MSRHRNIKNIDVYDEQDEYSDYSRSAEDNCCISPSVAQFIYHRDQNGLRVSLVDHMPEEDGKCEKEMADLSSRMEEGLQLPKTVTASTVVVEQSRSVTICPFRTPGFESPRPLSATPTAVVDSKRTERREAVMEADPDASSSAMAISTKRKKSRRIPEDTKPILNLVVVGHVDAGKSTLMGHLLYLIGNVDEKTMNRFKHESQKIGKTSFAYAWVLDESSEERARGVTMDVAQTRFETAKFSITLLDAPGHRDFIPNMITGASQADVALLVVNATSGEFESGFDLGGQTREHTLLVRSLGVKQLLVAVNKMDTVDWSERRYLEIQERLQGFLRQVGWADSCTFVPCSGLQGVNLTRSPEASCPLTRWYNGPTLLQAIDLLRPAERALDSPLRFIVGNVYKASRGSNFYASGKVVTGSIDVGDKVVVLPSGTAAVVKSVRNSDDEEVADAIAGEQCSLLLTGMDMSSVSSGDMVCHSENPINVSSKIKAKIVTFAAQMPVVKGMQLIMHCNGAQQPCYVSKLLFEINKTTGAVVKSRPRCLAPNSGGIVELRTEKPMCLETATASKELCRLTLRFKGATIAFGLITELM